MPRGDGTGPLGMGPMSGRGAGFCAGYPVPGYLNGPRGGSGWGGRGWLGRGGGRGFRHMFYATGLTGWQPAAGGYPVGEIPPVVSSDQEMAILKSQVKAMEASLKRTQERIMELEKEEKSQ